MASNQYPRYMGNMYNAVQEPLIVPGKFEAGSGQAIKEGELLELTADSNTSWTPMDADFAGSANVAIAIEEIKNGDLMGYYSILVPRPGDRFIFDLDTANNPALGTALYYDSSEQVSESGSNILAYVSGWDHYPKQGHGAEDIVSDQGETLRDVSKVILTFKEAVSYWKALNVA